jgi:hypothetical protein
MSQLWEIVKRRLSGDHAPVVGATGAGRKAPLLLTLPAGGDLMGITPGAPPYAPAVPPQPPHETPRGRPGWWSAALPQARLLYPDDALNALLEEMRRTVPILDRALTVLVGLCGQVEFEATRATRTELEAWAHALRVNQTGRGLQGWIEAHLDALLLYGKGVTEIVPAHAHTDVYALMNLDPRSVVFQVTADPLVLLPLQRQHVNAFLMPLNPELLLISVNGGHTDSPHGFSLYRSLPYVAQAARTIENATAQVWQRLGCPPFHINWDPGAKFTDPQGTLAAQGLAVLQSQWTQSQAGRATAPGGSGANSVGDYFTAGNVKVSVIGHEHTPLPLAETWRVFEEQLVSVTGLPSWLLGFHWATTERMALQQSEILVANIESLRRHVQPQLEQLIDLRQRFAGRRGRVKVRWSKVSLHDLTEQARGKAWEAQARGREIANAAAMWQLGFWDQARALQAVDPTAAGVATARAQPPTMPSAGSGQVAPTESYHG